MDHSDATSPNPGWLVNQDIEARIHAPARCGARSAAAAQGGTGARTAAIHRFCKMFGCVIRSPATSKT